MTSLTLFETNLEASKFVLVQQPRQERIAMPRVLLKLDIPVDKLVKLLVADTPVLINTTLLQLDSPEKLKLKNVIVYQVILIFAICAI